MAGSNNPNPKMNQAGMTPAAGLLDLSHSGNNAFACLYNPLVADRPLVNGEIIRLVDLGDVHPVGVNPVVSFRDDAVNPIFGVVVFTAVRNSHPAGSVLDVAGRGCVVWMQAGAVFNNGDTVYPSIDDAGIVRGDAGGNPPLGIALDKAKMPGDFVRVQIGG